MHDFKASPWERLQSALCCLGSWDRHTRKPQMKTTWGGRAAVPATLGKPGAQLLLNAGEGAQVRSVREPELTHSIARSLHCYLWPPHFGVVCYTAINTWYRCWLVPGAE